MKHQAIIKLALCTASALLLGGSIARAQVQTVRLGYCNGDKIGTALRPQGEEGNYNELSAAIRIPKEILSKYVGDTIYQISYANETKVGSFMTVFIKTDLESRTGGVVQTVTNHKVGWNHVTLKTPYPIKADKDIYIGYTAYPNASEINDAKILCMEYYHGGTPGADWYGLNGQWWSTKVDLIDYDFCIRAYAKGPKMPSKDIGIDRVSNYDMVRQNAITPVKLQVSNYGVDTIRSFVVEARKDGETFATKPVNNVSLNPNEMAIIDIPDMAFPQEGNNYFNVFVSQVNGGEDSDQSDNTKDSYVYCVPENAEPYPRTVLMEEFTSTRKGGVIATKLREGDSVTAVMEYHGEDVEVITKKGMSIHLRGSDIPTQGKNTLGVKGMNIAEDDSVAQVLLIPKDTIGLVVIAETGQGKRIPLSELPPQGRGGKGVSITPKNDFAGAVFITKEDSRILFVMPSGVKSESARQIPLHSRVNTGVQIIKPIGKIAHVVLGS